MGKKSEQSQKTYDKIALEYDSTQEGNYTRNHKAELIEKVAVKNGDAILDVACGNGFLLAELSKKAKVNAFGIDIAEKMITIAKKRHPNCTFLAQPCFPLSFEPESMNVITVSCAFHHFENPQGFADECMRVLKDDGAIYLAEPFCPSLIRWITNVVVVPFSHKGDVRVYSSKELCAFFEAAGFADIQTYTKDTVLFFAARKTKTNSGGRSL